MSPEHGVIFLLILVVGAAITNATAPRYRCVGCGVPFTDAEWACAHDDGEDADSFAHPECCELCNEALHPSSESDGLVLPAFRRKEPAGDGWGQFEGGES